MVWAGWYVWNGSAGEGVVGKEGQADKQYETVQPSSLTADSPPPTFGTVTDVIDAITIEMNGSYDIRYLGLSVPTTLNKVECIGKEALQANESMLGKIIRLEEDPMLLRARNGAWTRYVWVADDEVTQDAYTKSLNGETVLGLIKPVNPDGTAEPIVSPSATSDNVNVSPALESLPKEDIEPKFKEYMVSERIIEMGLGFPLLAKDMKYYDKLAAAARYSSATKRGLWGKCEISQDDKELLQVQTIEECIIKGVTVLNGDKIYRTPSCAGYKDTVVLGYKGGKWLCSEEEAVASGFVKAIDCK